MLRGLVEKHMETCEYERCRCLGFYKATNSSHRYELAYAKFQQMTTVEDVAQHKKEEEHLVKLITSKSDGEIDDTFAHKLENIDRQKRKRMRFYYDFLNDVIDAIREKFSQDPSISHFAAYF